MEQDNDLQALLQLLDDIDLSVYENVADSILKIGYRAAPALKELMETTKSPLVKERSNYLHTKLRYLYFASEIKVWAFVNDGYNWDFIYLLSEFCNPQFNKQDAKDRLNRYEELFFQELQEIKTPEENAKILQKLIFKDLSFKFSYHPTDLSALLLGSFYENKKGSPFMFCMLYTLLAEKRHLPIFTVAFPANLVLVYAKKEIPSSQDDILFYINPANGEIFSKNGIDLFLKRYNLENKIQYFLPCSTSEVAVLYLYALSEAYLSVGQDMKASELKNFAEIIIGTVKQGDNNLFNV